MTTKRTLDIDSTSAGVGESLPNKWVWISLNEIAASIKYGHTQSANYEPIGPKFLRITDIQDGQVDWSSVPYCVCSEEELEKYQLLDGDIVFARTGATTGKSYLITNCPEAVFASYLIRVRIVPYIRSKYVAYFFQSHAYWTQILTVRKGSAQPGVNATKLSELQVPVAPLFEQEGIVNEIEKQFTRLDAAVANLKRVQANLERYKASVLKAACEGRLVSQDPDDETAEGLLERILAERRRKWEEREWEKLIERAKKKAAQARRRAEKRPARISDLEAAEWQDLVEEEYGRYLPKGSKWKEKYKEPEPVDAAELPELPEGWVWATWEQLSPRVTVGHVGSMKNEYVETGIPFLRNQNVRELRFDPNGLKFITREFEERLLKSRLKPEDLVVVRSGSVGVTCVIPDRLVKANCADLVIIQKPHGMISQFGAYYMNSLAKRLVREGQVGVALIHFNTRSVASMPVPLPPLAEQFRIVNEVELRLSTLESLIPSVALDLSRGMRLRQAILQQAFSGRLVPQDPNDEPASVLLSRHKDGNKRG